VKGPGGLAFAEFRGYEAWQAFPSVGTKGDGYDPWNPVMIETYHAGFPGEVRVRVPHSCEDKRDYVFTDYGKR
jgi:hypothetical protein